MFTKAGIYSGFPTAYRPWQVRRNIKEKKQVFARDRRVCVFALVFLFLQDEGFLPFPLLLLLCGFVRYYF